MAYPDSDKDINFFSLKGKIFAQKLIENFYVAANLGLLILRRR